MLPLACSSQPKATPASMARRSKAQFDFLGRLASNLWDKSLILFGRGSWIRTNDLQYPKLPRYQAALYPDHLGNVVDTRFKRCQQG
jgi:hypothetical protein